MRSGERGRSIQTKRLIYRQIDRETDSEANRQQGKETNSEADRQTLYSHTGKIRTFRSTGYKETMSVTAKHALVMSRQ